MLGSELLPHVGDDETIKAGVLCDMARRCALVAMGMSLQDDRDSYVNKRVDPSGILLGNLFRQCYSRYAGLLSFYIFTPVMSQNKSNVAYIQICKGCSQSSSQGFGDAVSTSA